MEEFPADVAIAEKRTGGNPNIIYSKEFMPAKKPDATTPSSAAKGMLIVPSGAVVTSFNFLFFSNETGSTSRSRRGQQVQPNTPSIPRVMIKPDHDTRILVPSAPAASVSLTTTPTGADNKYKCHLCNYSTNRINTFVWHQKTHNSPKTPQASATQKCTITQIPSTSTVSPDESIPSTSVKLQIEDEINVLVIDETLDKIPEPVDEVAEQVNKVSEPVTLPGKSKGKRLRKEAQETRTKLAEKVPKTDNKLKKILDDWSDDEFGEAGPSGLTSNISANCIVLETDDVDDTQPECSVKKKIKFDNEETSNNSNGAEEIKSDLDADDTKSPKILSSVPTADVVDDKMETKPKSGKKNTKDETIVRQSARSQTNDVAVDEVKPQTRFSLRSGRTTLTDENSTLSPITPKRRGRAKRNANDTVKCETVSDEINDSEIKPVLPEKSETIESSEAPSGDKISDESANPVSVQAVTVNKSNSKTSRKGKPRRKEEIKLGNNISVAVLVEKTCPSAEKGSEQKVEIPAAEDNECTNVVHKKRRFMSTSSADDHQKSSSGSMEVEAIQLPEPVKESNNHTDDPITVHNQQEKNIEITEPTIHSNDQNEENNVEQDKNDVAVASINLNSTELTEKVSESSTATETPDEQRVTSKCYDRSTIPKKDISLDQTDDTSIDTYESPSSSNLQQRAPKRYENTRNRRKSDRRTTSDDEQLLAMVKEIDDTSGKNGHMSEKSEELPDAPSEESPKLSENLNDSGSKEGTDETNLYDQLSENSNSKTSTPEKADTSKELDCFDFTEDDCVKLPPQVLNRRKRLPPAKVFELEDIDKIEEQRKIDEETSRVAQQREEENQKLHAELENLLNLTTPVTLPEIPVGPKVHENFPERRAEKDPEKILVKESEGKDRMLPPKERNKRIFKYRNRNRRPDPEAKVNCDAEENKSDNSSYQAVCFDENVVVTSIDAMEVDQKLQSNDLSSETETDTNPSAHDLKIEIAETLINFPLLSPQTDMSEQTLVKVIAKPATKRKESVKSTKNVRKSRNAATVVQEVCREEITIIKESKELLDDTTKDSILNDKEDNPKSSVSHMIREPSTNSPSHFHNLELQSTPNESTDKPLLHTSVTKTIETETVAAHSTIKPTTSRSVRDFSRIRHIEKIDNHTSIQVDSDEVAALTTHQLPLTKTVILKAEGNSIITQIPKKRKSQTDDDVPAFVIERPKDQPDDSTESNSQQTLAKKEPKSFIVTKTIKKQITGELPKQIASNAGVGVHQNAIEVTEKESIEKKSNLKDPQQKSRANASPNTAQLVAPISIPLAKATQITGVSERISIEQPVIVTSHLIIQKNTPPVNAQKRTGTTSTAATANVIGNLSANRPCTIAPAKKASYRRPSDMTGLTQKQIGIDGKGNPVMIYTKITPIVTQTPPIISQATFGMKQQIPSTSQLGQSLQSNQGNQFVITSKGALINHANKPFISTTHSTQPTLTNRPNIQVHTQIIRSPNTSVFHHTQQQQPQQQHLSNPQSNQLLIHQTKPTILPSQISSIAPVKKQPAANRRNVVNKSKATATAAPEQSNDNATLKNRIVRRISKNQSPAAATQQMQSNQQQQQVILNSEINHIGNAVPPLVPLNDQSMLSRQQLAKQQQPTQMTFIQEPQVVQSKTSHVEVVEQQQENIQEILALPGDTPGFGGPPGSYFLCKLNEMGVYIPIDHQPLYLDVTDNTNLLKPNAPAERTIITEAVAEMNEIEIPQQQVSVSETENFPSICPSFLYSTNVYLYSHLYYSG